MSHRKFYCMNLPLEASVRASMIIGQCLSPTGLMVTINQKLFQKVCYVPKSNLTDQILSCLKHLQISLKLLKASCLTIQLFI